MIISDDNDKQAHLRIIATVMKTTTTATATTTITTIPIIGIAASVSSKF